MSQYRYLTKCHRALMNNGGIPFQGNAAIPGELLKAILDIDDKIELHDLDGRVHCYRCIRKRNGSDDILVHQFQLKYPPGSWLITCLQECDMWKKHKTIEKATQAQINQYGQALEQPKIESRKKVTDVIEATKGEFEKYVDRQSSFSLPKGSTPKSIK